MPSELPPLPPPSPDPATGLPAYTSSANPGLPPSPPAASPAPPVTPTATWKRRNRSGSLAAQVSEDQSDSDGMGGEISATELRQEVSPLVLVSAPEDERGGGARSWRARGLALAVRSRLRSRQIVPLPLPRARTRDTFSPRHACDRPRRESGSRRARPRPSAPQSRMSCNREELG